MLTDAELIPLLREMAKSSAERPSLRIVLTDAADAIARLNTENTQLRLDMESHYREAQRVKAEIERLKANIVEQRVAGHGDGQEDAIADVNAGRVDDLIRPRLERLKAAHEQEVEAAWKAGWDKGHEGCNGGVCETHEQEVEAAVRWAYEAGAEEFGSFTEDIVASFRASRAAQQKEQDHG